MITRLSCSALALTFALAAGNCNAALAQNSSDDQAQTSDDIVVTAQRRDQRLQDVPVAVTAIGGEDLVSRRIENVTDLNRAVPSLNVQRTTKVPVIFLRGIGNNSSSPGQEQNVAVYVDGVYYPSLSASVFSFDDLERIEVLKGPQGTLFGRNATGGVIQVVTRDPGQTSEGRVALGYGNFETLQASGFLSGGLSEDLAASLSVRYSNQRDGWGTNVFDGGEVNKGKDFSARLKTVFTPADATKLTLTAGYSRSRSDFGTSRQILAGTPTLPPSFGSIRFNGNIYDRNANYPSQDTIAILSGAIRIDQKIGDLNLVSITAGQRTKATSFADVDQSPIDRLHVIQHDITRSASQELQLQSGSGSAVQWVAGFFYFYSRAGNEPQRQEGSLIGANNYRDIYGTQTTNSYSLFGQATLPLMAGLNLTAGGRYTIDEKSFAGRIETPAGVTSRANDKNEWKRFDFRIGLDGRLSDDVLLYANVATGFKSGVYNVVSIAAPPVSPEKLTSYEAGIKSDWFGGSLRVNASGFYYDYRNLQLLRQLGTAFVLQNAASAEIYGLEVETQLKLSRALSFSGGLSLIHSEYGHFPDAAANTPGANGLGVQGVIDATGNRLQRTPNLTLNLGVNYAVPLSSGELIFSGGISHNGGFYWETDNRLYQKAYTLLDAGIRYSPDAGGLEVQLWIKNLAKEKYYSYVTSSNGSPDTGAPGAPRTFGATIGYRF